MNKKGLSLIEILISLAILSVIMVMTTPLILVKTRNSIIDTQAASVWNIPNDAQESTPITLNQTAQQKYPNFIVGASESALTADDVNNPGNLIPANEQKINDETGALYVYNQGTSNNNLPGLTVSKTLFFLSNIIDCSTKGVLSIVNNANDTPTHFITLSDKMINIRSRLVIDNKDETANILIGNNQADIANKGLFDSIIPDGVTGLTVIGRAKDNTLLPAGRNNALYILAGKDYNAPVIEADENMIHIAGALTVTNDGTTPATAPISANQIYFASDKRLKNIKGEYKKGMNEVLKINPVEFTYKSDKENTVNIGVIAQELKKILPEAVITRDDGYYAVKEAPVFYALLNSVKELNSNYEKIKKNNDELEKQIAHLKLNK